MPPKAPKPPAKPQAPVRADACCGLNFTTLIPALLPIYMTTAGALHICSKCSWEVKDHPVGPAAAAPVVAAPLQAAGAPPAVTASAHEVALAGPKASLALVAESPLAFLGVIAAWKNSTWCADDSDKVQRRLEEIQGAWIRGAYRIIRKHFRVLGAAEDTSRTFAYKTIPDGTVDEVSYRQERGLEVLACKNLAEAVLDLAQAYARKRCIIDRVTNQVAVDSELRTDEWFAITEVRKAPPRAGPGELEPAETEFSRPEKALWWFLFICSVETTNMQARLEAIVREYGAAYRAKNPKAFCARVVWDADYSPEVAARRQSESAERLALTAAVLSVHTAGKRQRDPSAGADVDGGGGSGDTRKKRSPAQVRRQQKKKEKWEKKKLDRAAATGALAQDDALADSTTASLATSTPSHSRSTTSSAGGSGNSPGTGSATSSGQGSGGGGRGGGRGNGRGRFSWSAGGGRF